MQHDLGHAVGALARQGIPRSASAVPGVIVPSAKAAPCVPRRKCIGAASLSLARPRRSAPRSSGRHRPRHRQVGADLVVGLRPLHAHRVDAPAWRTDRRRAVQRCSRRSVTSMTAVDADQAVEGEPAGACRRAGALSQPARPCADAAHASAGFAAAALARRAASRSCGSARSAGQGAPARPAATGAAGAGSGAAGAARSSRSVASSSRRMRS